MRFYVEQIALNPVDPSKAIALLSEMGLAEWARDHVVADGVVFGDRETNEATLQFNYQATRGVQVHGGASTIDVDAIKPLELEVLHYTRGDNWMNYNPNSVSHLGMHCSADELTAWRAFFAARNIEVAQEVNTLSHTNPVIAGKRQYTYVIFATREILSVDIKFIVRRNVIGA